MNISLRKKFCLYFLATISTCILIISLISNHMIDKKFDRYLIDRQEDKIQNLISAIQEDYDTTKSLYDLNYNEIMRYCVIENIYIQINDSNDNILFSSSKKNNKCGQHKNFTGKQALNNFKNLSNSLSKYYEKEFYLYDNNEKVATITIGHMVISPFNNRDINFKNTLNHSFIISSLITFIIGIIVSVFLSNSLSKPLKELHNISTEITKGNLKARCTSKSNTYEIYQLSKSINYLAETLENQEFLRKKLVSNMAHELRTPLTVLQTHVEALIDGIITPTKDTLISCHDEILRLTKLIKNLQDIAQLEDSNLILNKTKFNLSKTMEDMVNTFNSLCDKKSIQIHTDIEPNVYVFMDMDKIKQILFNLISNAYKYSPHNSNIYLRLKTNHNKIILEIQDEGIGINKKDLPHIFERFYKCDESRNSDSTGIGLSIVKTLVDSHEGIIRVSSTINAGTLFKIEF